MRHNLIFSIAAAAALLLAGSPSWAEEEMNPAAMAKALPQASVSLENATRVSEREGKTLSAKYEIEKGALQLSVYTMKGDRFSELILDKTSGAVAKDEWITDGDDLKAAQAQAAAMAKAKLTLDVAVANVVKGNAGYRAVSVTPSSDTLRSVRGKPTRYTPPACTLPDLPSACPTWFQSGSAAKVGVATMAVAINGVTKRVIGRMAILLNRASR